MRVKSARVYESQTLVINFDGGFGWIVATFCEERGAVSIMSDWGHANFVWPPRNIGGPPHPHKVKLFFARAGIDYILNKFSHDQKAFKDVIDSRATIKRFKEQVIEFRRERWWDKDKARRVWDDIELYADDIQPFDGDVNMNGGYNRWYENMSEHFDEPYELIGTRPSPQWESYRDIVIPVLQRWIVDQSYARDPGPGDTARH